MTLHANISPMDNHTPYRWVVADATARAALTLVVTDEGKKAWQQSDNTEWVLITAGTATWVKIGGIGPQGIQGPAGSILVRTDNTNATSDLVMAIGDHAFLNSQASTTHPLHIASAAGQMYQLHLRSPLSPTISGPIELWPNNVQYVGSFQVQTNDAFVTSPSRSFLTVNAFNVGGGSVSVLDLVYSIISTSQATVKSQGLVLISGTSYLINRICSQSLASVASLGTIHLPAAQSLDIEIVRVA